MGSRASPPPPSGCGACPCLPTLWPWIRSRPGSLRWRRSSPRARATSRTTCGSPDACGRRSSGSRVAGRWRAPARVRVCTAPSMGSGAVEEAMLQHPDSGFSLLEGRREPSATPAATVHGVEIRSGDILVSRGGYPTSALIARGNDYPGNFSHVGLVHVDSISRSEEHTSELQSRLHLVCRLLLEKKKQIRSHEYTVND